MLKASNEWEKYQHKWFRVFQKSATTKCNNNCINGDKRCARSCCCCYCSRFFFRFVLFSWFLPISTNFVGRIEANEYNKWKMNEKTQCLVFLYVWDFQVVMFCCCCYLFFFAFILTAIKWKQEKCKKKHTATHNRNA